MSFPIIPATNPGFTSPSAMASSGYISMSQWMLFARCRAASNVAATSRHGGEEAEKTTSGRRAFSPWKKMEPRARISRAMRPRAFFAER